MFLHAGSEDSDQTGSYNNKFGGRAISNGNKVSLDKQYNNASLNYKVGIFSPGFLVTSSLAEKTLEYIDTWWFIPGLVFLTIQPAWNKKGILRDY